MAGTVAATLKRYKIFRILSILLCILGICLSIYAYYVEVSKEKNPKFVAFCDINKYMSCSKVFTSKYGRGFGLIEKFTGRNHWLNQPNSVFGLSFYTLMMIMGETATKTTATVQVLFTVAANCGSVYLGYILYFVLQDFCIICVSTYVVNFLLFLVTVARRQQLSNLQQKVK